MTRELLKQSLDALALQEPLQACIGAHAHWKETAMPVISAIHAELAKPQAEPVAWRYPIDNASMPGHWDVRYWVNRKSESFRGDEEPLYAAPPPAVPKPLTKECRGDDCGELASLKDSFGQLLAVNVVLCEQLHDLENALIAENQRKQQLEERIKVLETQNGWLLGECGTLRKERDNFRFALDDIASWNEGPTVGTHFDEPGSAEIARAALEPKP